MKRQGFTLIEIVFFIVLISILASSIMMAGNTGLLSVKTTSNQITANLLAQQCMEWLVGQRRLQGYGKSCTCPCTPPDNTAKSFCTMPVGSGFTITPKITCGTDGPPRTYYTITVGVTGNGNAQLATVISNY